MQIPERIKIVFDSIEVFNTINKFLGQKYSINLAKKIKGNDININYIELTELIIDNIKKIKKREIPDINRVRDFIYNKLNENIFNVFFIIERIIGIIYEQKNIYMDSYNFIVKIYGSLNQEITIIDGFFIDKNIILFDKEELSKDFDNYEIINIIVIYQGKKLIIDKIFKDKYINFALIQVNFQIKEWFQWNNPIIGDKCYKIGLESGYSEGYIKDIKERCNPISTVIITNFREKYGILVNSKIEIIGIMIDKYTAIPSLFAKQFISRIIENIPVFQGYLGISWSLPNPFEGNYNEKFFNVIDIDDNIKKIGIKKGDIITTNIINSSFLYKKDEKILLNLLREDEKFDIFLIVSEFFEKKNFI